MGLTATVLTTGNVCNTIQAFVTENKASLV